MWAGLAKSLASCLQMFVIYMLDGLGVGSYFQLSSLACAQCSTQMAGFYYKHSTVSENDWSCF